MGKQLTLQEVIAEAEKDKLKCITKTIIMNTNGKRKKEIRIKRLERFIANATKELKELREEKIYYKNDSVAYTSLSVRAMNGIKANTERCLFEMTIKHLSTYSLREMTAWRNVGALAIKEYREVIEAAGLTLKEK